MGFRRRTLLDGHRPALLTGSAFALSVMLLLTGDETNLSELVPASGVVAYALVLCAAVLTYFHWRMESASGESHMSARLAAWLTVGLTAGATNGMLQLAPIGDGGDAGAYQWSMVVQLVLLLLLCVMASFAERVDLPADPARAGVVTAAAVIGTHAAAFHKAPPLVLSGVEAALLSTCVLLAGLVFAWILAHRTGVSAWARRRIAASVVLVTAAQCAVSVASDRATLMVGAIVAYFLSALILCTMTQQLLRSSVLRHQADMDRLHESLAEVRAKALGARELLHEVGSTLAGITTASQVMLQGQAVPAHRRQRLESMVTAELGRLERLFLASVTGPEPAYGADREMDLDEVVEHLVVSHQARGRDIAWAPSGQRAVGDADELAELLNILLENAARHGGGGVDPPVGGRCGRR